MAENKSFWTKVEARLDKFLGLPSQSPRSADVEMFNPNPIAKPAPQPVSQPASPPSVAAKSAIRTYALIGDDSKAEDAAFSNRGDVTIIRANPNQSIEEAIKDIKTPANIILVAHGGQNGTFTWNNGQIISYDRLLGALPREGVTSLTLNSCYGGTANAESFLKEAPPGMLVQSMVGAQTLGVSVHSEAFARETVNETNPVSLFIKTLDNFDPKLFHEFVRRHNQATGQNNDSNPENALPHIIGMGGNPPKKIYLDLEAERINSWINTNTLEAAWSNSVTRVQAAFETNHYVLQSNNHRRSNWQNLGPEAEKKLDDDIARVAGMMRRGEPLGGETPIERAENKRIAYALTAAFLDESGALDLWRSKQIAQVPSAIKEAVLDKKQVITTGNQSSGVAKELEEFAKKFGIQGVDDNGNLTKSEIQAIQGALGVEKSGAIGKKTFAAYERALHEGHLPTPSTPSLSPAKVIGAKRE